jgi:DNA polymerase-3 subunit epsilon
MFFWKRKKQPHWDDDWPEEVKSYVRLNHEKGTSGEQYVVFDFETTGLNPKTDDILSFAFLKIHNGSIELEQRLEGFLLPSNSKAIQSANIHHITQSDRNNGIPLEDFLLQALTFIGNAKLVGHHVAFDMACLNRLLNSKYGIQLLNSSMDTAKLGARLERAIPDAYSAEKKYKTLDELCHIHGILPEARHSASGDVYTTSLLFLILLSKAEKRKIRW